MIDIRRGQSVGIAIPLLVALMVPVSATDPSGGSIKERVKLLHTFGPHDGAVFSTAFSPDGRHLAVAFGGEDRGAVSLWNVNDGTRVHDFVGHKSYVYGVTISPDGESLASAGADGTVRLWEVATGKPRHILDGYGARIYDVEFSPNGKLVAATNGDHVILADSQSGEKLQILKSGDNPPSGIAFSPDGRFIAWAANDEVRMWETATGRPIQTFEGKVNGNSLSFSKDGRLIVAGGSSVVLWDVETGEQRLEIEQNGWSYRPVAFSPVEDAFAFGDHHGVGLYATSGERLWYDEHAHRLVVSSVGFSPDGRFLASGSWDKTVRCWRVELPR